MADDKEAERGGERVSRPDPDPDQGNPMPDQGNPLPDRDKSTPDPGKSTPDPGNPLPDPGNNSPDPGSPLPERRGNCDQERAQKLADLVAATSLATSLPRHRETARELAELRQRLGEMARDVLQIRGVLNAIAEQAGNGRRRPNVVIISPGDLDPASIAADLIG